MHRVGLALSGGGFRATLYHLGVVRFLRDAGTLPKITHITTVSGGSILGAHLTLNWEKYCGSESEFDQAADEIIRFVQLDVRNRIVRRFPFASMANMFRRWLRMGSSRQLTRPGLLERHYEKFLYGDVALSQLPDYPQLHILSTNLSEGCLCSFNSDGLILQRRAAGQRERFESIRLSLATVPMAVTASSAFPGFFPPLELKGWDVGAEKGEFDRQAFTDGGVYDNLGLRMFRCIEQSLVCDAAPLRREDFHELDDVTAAFMSVDNLPENTPLRRLRELLDSHAPQRAKQSRASDDFADTMINGLWEIIRSERLYLDPIFQGMELADQDADSLLHYSRTSGQKPEMNDSMWLNRQIIESALRQVVGKPCLRSGRDGFDAILVSDAGGKFKVDSDGRAGGLIRTALRSSDILMDRVRQLELEAFENTPGVLFFPITDVVDKAQDRWAPHPKIQRQAARIRTDLDRFSNLEVSALVQHGYCVARKAFQGSNLFGSDLPDGAPWDPLRPDTPDGQDESTQTGRLSGESQALRTARRLQYATLRRTWSTVFSLRDWPTYVWIPLLAFVTLSLPYALYKLNDKAQQQRMVLSAIAGTSPVYRQLLDLLENGPTQSFEPAPFVEAETLEVPDFTGYEIISDTRIIDLRHWSGSTKASFLPFVHERVRIRRLREESDNTHLRFQLKTLDDKPFLSCKTTILSPVVSRMRQPDGSFLWELDLDFSHVPRDTDIEVIVEGTVVSEMAEEVVDGGHFSFTIAIKTGLAQIWMLMPEGRTHDYFQLSSYPVGEPQLAQVVAPETSVELPFGSIATFRFINPQAELRYECRWRWVEQLQPPY